MTDSPNPFPEAIRIRPLSKPPRVTVSVPGSKSITNRALVLGALSEPLQGSELRGVLQSEDTEVMVAALQALGFRIQADWPNARLHVRRGAHASPIPMKEAAVFVGNSGTTMRFLTAMVSLGHGRFRLDGVARMRERPIQDLLSALGQLGVRAYAELDNGHPPVLVETKGITGGRVRIKGDVSSQFLSGLL
ncbi:MAG TPA: 3-phosphoshikimate 1-carboxyvinyltransferase, partial [Gemmataceae bacterium]